MNPGASGMPRLTYIDLDGRPAEARFDLRLRMGRMPDQDLQLLDKVVSKEHAVIERGSGPTPNWVLRDLGSRNGTLVNGELVQHPVRLYDGDLIALGATELTFRVDGAPAPLMMDSGMGARVRITEPVAESAIRKRLAQDDGAAFPRGDQVEDLEELRAHYEKLRVANELNHALSMEFDRDRLLDRILQQAIGMFGADRGVILLMNPTTDEAEPVCSRERQPDPRGRDITISSAILGEVVSQRTGVLSSDAQMDSRFEGSRSIMIQGVRATMSVPLLYQGNVLGVIHLDSQMTSGIFTERDLSLLSGFANQAARAIEHFRLMEAARKEALAREQLNRLLPPELVDEVMAGRLDIKRGGTLRHVSILFADIRGFTSLCERSNPESVVELLNEYFDLLVDVVFRLGGTLDKFIGDEIMAVWGAPIPVADHCSRAVQAGLQMQQALQLFNEERAARGVAPLDVGIGVNTGEVVAGYMGSARAMDYTVVGDVVNTASRFCSVARAGEVVISDAVLGCLGNRFAVEALEERKLKGKSESLQLYRVVGGPDQAPPLSGHPDSDDVAPAAQVLRSRSSSLPPAR